MTFLFYKVNNNNVIIFTYYNIITTVCACEYSQKERNVRDNNISSKKYNVANATEGMLFTRRNGRI